MPSAPKARVATAAPRRPDELSALADPTANADPQGSPAVPPPHGDGGVSDKGSCCSSGLELQDQPDHVSLRVEQLEAIKELFEVHDFACAERRKGRVVTDTLSSSSTAASRSARRETTLSYAERLDEKKRYGVALKPLKRTPSAEIRRVHETLFSTAAIDSNTPDEAWQSGGGERAQRTGTATPDTQCDSERLASERRLVYDELFRLRQWRAQQSMLAAEALEEQAAVQAVAAASRVSPTAVTTTMGSYALSAPPAFPGMVPSTSGVSLHYFANFIVAPFFSNFFPPAPAAHAGPSLIGGGDGGPSHPRVSFQSDRSTSEPPPDPRTSLAAHFARTLDALPEVQQLFRVMDTNADQRVSWDEFCQYILETGQRRLLEGSDGQQPSGRASPAQEGAPASGVSLRYELDFARQPTNESVWQSQYPLVHYLFHKEAVSKLLQSHTFPRFITAGSDGLVKLWRTEPRLHDDTNRAVIIHERNLLSLTSPITDIALSTPSMGDAELVAVIAMDGTLTLLRVATGEMVRTLQGVRTGKATEVSVMNEVAKGRRGVDHESREYEAQDLLSLRARQPGVSSTVLRQPYTVDAYHNEAVEIFFGQASRYFRGLEVMAPTYEHLKRPISLTADVLFSFGASPDANDRWLTANAAKANHRAPPRFNGAGHADGGADDRKQSTNWFATAVGLAAVTTGGGARRMPSGHYVLLGFENGVLQAYALAQSWFQLSNLSAARVEPPSGRRPAFSAKPHSGPITHIVVSEAADMLFSAGSDGAIEVRSLSRLEASMMMLGEAAVPGLTRAPALSTAAASSALSSHTEAQGHSKRVTCMAWHDGQRLLVTGGMDYRVFFWSSRSPRPVLRVDLREQQRNVSGLNSLGACGYPVDVSFMQHRSEPLRVIVLDSKRVIRFLNALNGQLMGFLVDHAPESLALGDMLVARYEAANDRLLLGGRCLRVWNTVKEGEYAEDYHGHRKPVLFMQWHHALQAMVTADDEHVVMWRMGFGSNETARARQERRRAAHHACCEQLQERAERESLLARLDGPRPGTAPKAARGNDPLSPGPDGHRDDADEDGAGGPSKDGEKRGGPALPVLYDDVYDGLCPTAPTDRTRFNHTYTSSQMKLLKSFHVEDGIRSIAMDSSSLTAALFVAVLRENAVIQINIFNGAALRRFTFAPCAHDIYGLSCGEARMTASEVRPSPLLAAAYEEAADTGVTSLYHVLAEDDVQSHQDATSGDVASSAARSHDPASHESGGAVHTEANRGVAPYRHILSRGSLVTSVLVMSSMNLVVMGGRGQLFMTPVADSTAFAVPFRTLVDQANIEEVELRRALMAATQHRQLGLPANAVPPPSASGAAAAAAAVAPANPRTSTAVLTLVALFPGRLVNDPAVEETRMNVLLRNAEEQRRRTRLSAAGLSITGQATASHTRVSSIASESQAVDVTHRHSSAASLLDAPPGSPARQASVAKKEDGLDGTAATAAEEATDNLDALLEKALVSETHAQHGGSGYIGQLCPLGASGYILSANHEGVLQLWNVRTSSEVLRFRVTLTPCTVTTVCTNVPDHRTSLASVVEPVLVAVGDEAGYVVVLDLSELPWDAAQPLDMLPDLERCVLVVDRWRAHTKDVRSVRFLPSQVAAGAVSRSAGLAGPPRCARTATFEAMALQLRVARSKEKQAFGYDDAYEADGETDGDDSLPSPCASSPLHSAATTLPGCVSRPILLATTSEDTYSYVWHWQTGLLNCLGCFGMGPLTVVSPPLSEPSYRVPHMFELTRRLYVLRRLVQDKGLFRHFAAAASAPPAPTGPSSAAAHSVNSPFTASFTTPARGKFLTSVTTPEQGTPSRLNSPREAGTPGSGTSAQSSRGAGGHTGGAAGQKAGTAATAAAVVPSEEELDEALAFMAREVHAMMNRDAATLLSTWGSLSDAKAQIAAEEASVNRCRLAVLASSAATEENGRTPTGVTSSLGTSLPSFPTSQATDHAFAPARASTPPQPRPPTLFDSAGLDGAYGWMAPLSAATATATTSGSSASYEAPPLEVTLPWLREGTTTTSGLANPRELAQQPPSLLCAFTPSSSTSTSGAAFRENENTFPTEYSPYVLAFMRGAFAQEDARACLRDTVTSMRSAIVKWNRRQLHIPPPRLEGRGSFFASREGRGRTASVASRVSALPQAATASSPTVSVGTPSAPPPAATEKAPSPPASSTTATASDTVRAGTATTAAAEVPSAMSPTRVFFRRGSVKTNTSGTGSSLTSTASPPPKPVTLTTHASAAAVEEEEGGSQRVGRFRIRGPRGEPMYRVGYTAPSPVVRTTTAPHGTMEDLRDTPGATQDRQPAALVRLSETAAAKARDANAPPQRPAPPLLNAHYRRLAAAAATDDLVTTARDPLDGRGVRLVGGGGGGGGGAILEDEEALANEDAAFVMHNAYLYRRREEALSQLLEVEAQQAQHQDAAQRKKSVKAAAEMGQVGLATFDDFAATGTTTALFGREHLLFDAPVAHKPVLANHLRDGLPLHLGAEREACASGEEKGDDVDWYTKRDRLRRQRQQEDALWNPSRIMLTLMDWEATLTAEERQAQAKRVAAADGPTSLPTGTSGSPTNSTASPTRTEGPSLQLPGFLPASLTKVTVSPPAVTNATHTTGEGESESAGQSPTTFANVTKDMQQSMAQTRSLNAVVALEVQHLRQIMREAMEERETIARDEFNTTGPLGMSDAVSSTRDSAAHSRRGLLYGSPTASSTGPSSPDKHTRQSGSFTLAATATPSQLRTQSNAFATGASRVASLGDSRRRSSVGSELSRSGDSYRRSSSMNAKR